MTTMTKAMKAAAIMVAVAATLTGCGRAASPVGTGMPAPAVAAAAPPPGATAIAAAAARKLMAVSGATAQLWGVNFYDARPSGQYSTTETYKVAYRGSFDTFYVEYPMPLWRVDMQYTGVAPLEHLSAGRFLFTVPEGQVLVINRVGTVGTRINGLLVQGIWRPGFESQDVYYLFGSGSRIHFDFEKGATVSGYTGEAAMFVGQRAGLAADGRQK